MSAFATYRVARAIRVPGRAPIVIRCALLDESDDLCELLARARKLKGRLVTVRTHDVAEMSRRLSDRGERIEAEDTYVDLVCVSDVMVNA